MRPARTAATTAALRRTTHRLVFGGGRSSLIAVACSSSCSTALVTGPRQDFRGPERAPARGDLLMARAAAPGRIAFERGAVGGGNRALSRQRAGGRAPRNAVAADESGDCRVVFFSRHRQIP